MRRTAATRHVVHQARRSDDGFDFSRSNSVSKATTRTPTRSLETYGRIGISEFCVSYIHTQRSVRTFSLASTQIVETKAPVFIKILVRSRKGAPYDFVHQTLGRARRRGASRCDEALARWRRADEHGDVPQVRRELGAREPVPGAAVRGLRHAVPRERLWRAARNVQVFRPVGRVPEGATRAARLPPPRSRARAGPRAPPPARARRAPEPGIARAPGPVRGGRVSPTRGRNRGQIISRRTRPESGPGFRVGTRGVAERFDRPTEGTIQRERCFFTSTSKKKNSR